MKIGRLIGTTRVQDIWRRLVSSPVMQNWSWSPLVHRAFQKNRQFFESIEGNGLKSLLRLGANKETNTTIATNQYPSFDDPSLLPVLTLHVRRGDFVDHCKRLSEWKAAYSGLNSFPQFAERDNFVVPKIVDGHFNVSTFPNGDPAQVESQEAMWKVYQKHCYPEIEVMVERVREVVTDFEKALREGKMAQSSFWDRVKGGRNILSGNSKALARKRLKKVYIMTNGNREWLDELKEAIIADAKASKSPGGGGWDFEWEWEDVSTNRNLQLGWEEKPVVQTLDMYVAQRSQLFVGNGVCFLSRVSPH